MGAAKANGLARLAAPYNPPSPINTFLLSNLPREEDDWLSSSFPALHDTCRRDGLFLFIETCGVLGTNEDEGEVLLQWRMVVVAIGRDAVFKLSCTWGKKNHIEVS
nr:hypothetical protein Iba_chr04eCG7750 [Ipomoea batatas]